MAHDTPRSGDTAERRSLWLVTRGQRMRYGCAILAIGLSNGCMLLAPLVGGYALDVITQGDLAAGATALAHASAWVAGDPIIVYLALSALAGLAVVAVGGGFMYLRGRWAALASEAIARRIREELYQRLHYLPASFFDAADTGDLVQRCSSDVETMRLFLSSQVIEIGRAVLMLAAMAPILFWRDAQLAALAIFLDA